MKIFVTMVKCPQVVLAVALLATIAACAGDATGPVADSSRGSAAPAALLPGENGTAARTPNTGDAVMFLFGVRGSSNEDFLASSSNPEVIDKARQQLLLAEADRKQHINGFISRSRKRANLTWSWQYIESSWNIADVTIGACDGRPSDVDANLKQWLWAGGQFCPLASYVKAELSS